MSLRQVDAAFLHPVRGERRGSEVQSDSPRVQRESQRARNRAWAPRGCHVDHFRRITDRHVEAKRETLPEAPKRGNHQKYPKRVRQLANQPC